jgi:hypothetical protein
VTYWIRIINPEIYPTTQSRQLDIYNGWFQLSCDLSNPPTPPSRWNLFREKESLKKPRLGLAGMILSEKGSAMWASQRLDALSRGIVAKKGRCYVPKGGRPPVL